MILTKQNFATTLEDLRLMVNGNNLEVRFGEVSNTECESVGTMTEMFSNVFLYKNQHPLLNEEYIESVRDEKEEFCIYLGDDVNIHSTTSFSVLRKIDDRLMGNEITFMRYFITIKEPQV